MPLAIVAGGALLGAAGGTALGVGALAGAAAGAGIASAVNSSDASSAAQKTVQGAISNQQQSLANLQFNPINIPQITAEAHQQAVANATQSLQLEAQLNPGVAATRQTLQNQVAQQLALGGQLSPDQTNAVTRAAEAGGGIAGLGSSSLPLTAAQLGLTSNQLMLQRQQQGEALLAANTLPQTGLNPGDIASLNVANTNALNQFNLSKAGANTSLLNSQIGAAQSNAQNTANIGGQLTGAISSAGAIANAQQANQNQSALIAALQNQNANPVNPIGILPPSPPQIQSPSFSLGGA